MSPARRPSEDDRRRYFSPNLPTSHVGLVPPPETPAHPFPHGLPELCTAVGATPNWFAPVAIVRIASASTVLGGLAEFERDPPLVTVRSRKHTVLADAFAFSCRRQASPSAH